MTVDGRQVLLSRITEEQWLQQVLTWARRAGWKVYHTRDSRGSDPGFPDLVLVKDSWVVAAELKSATGKVTMAQQGWLEALALSGINTYLWRPSDEEFVRAVLLRGSTA